LRVCANDLAIERNGFHCFRQSLGGCLLPQGVDVCKTSQALALVILPILQNFLR
jgi:hypothetical protein